MATLRQKQALNKLVENGGNASRAMLDVGYSPNTAKTPQKLTNSIGFIELCEKSGLTDRLLIHALVEDIESKKGSRKSELELAFKILGRLNQKIDPVSVNANIELGNQLSDDKKQALLALLR